MDVFLFGAGFSKFLYNKMPLMKDLGTLIEKSGIALPSVPSNFSDTLNAEEILSHLSEELPWESESLVLRKKATFIEISKLIGESIIKQEQIFNFDEFSHG